MANGKQARAAGKQPTPDTKAAKPSNTEPAKTQVERMFGGVEQPKELHIETSVPMPEYSDPDTDSSVKKSLDAVDAILSALGTEKFEATVIPYPKNRNNGQAAADFVLWEHIKKFAEKRAKETTEVATRQGVFGEPSSYILGETTIVYQTPGFVISIKQGNDTKMVNKENTLLVLAELKADRAAELLERCMKPRAGPTQKIISLK